MWQLTNLAVPTAILKSASSVGLGLATAALTNQVGTTTMVAHTCSFEGGQLCNGLIFVGFSQHCRVTPTSV